MRGSLTKAEVRLWARLKGQACEGFKFRRQHPIGRFFADFACSEAKLVVEVDGDAHQGTQAQMYDNERTAFLESQGWAIIRFTNAAVLHETSRVVEQITQSLLILRSHREAPSGLAGHLPHAQTGKVEEIPSQ
jgi:very-short-patch-repair endonuclease